MVWSKLSNSGGQGNPAVAYKKSFGEVLLADLSYFEPSLLEKQRHPGDVITPVVLRLVSKGLADGYSIVLLSRCNKLPWFVSYQEQENLRNRGLDRYLDFIQSFFPKDLQKRISISTAHRYKGLEKPIVIVLDAVIRSYPLIHPSWIFLRILGENPEKLVEEERRLFYVALTRAIEKLVIITDQKAISPFLKEIQNIQKVQSINWENYPPISGKTNHFVVKVGNQLSKGTNPTFAIKDTLKATGYQWHTAGWKGWAKSFPAENFCIEKVKEEIWSSIADGIEVRIFDDYDTLIAQYLVNSGNWDCLINKIR